LKSMADDIGLDDADFEHLDLHVHVPSGAIPKDGPSAGVTMITALTSVLTGLKVDPTVAMTGEITLRGAVLPVGGIKEKVLAAHRAGVKRVILPERNVADLEEVPAEIQQELEFIGVSRMDEVLRAALEDGAKVKLDLSQPDAAKPAEAAPAS
ncbi:MAG: S16 family serine protease, partial [Deltaproteobacteria bacterium]